MSCHACPPFTSSVCFGKVAIISGQTVLAELPVNAAFWLFVLSTSPKPYAFRGKVQGGNEQTTQLSKPGHYTRLRHLFARYYNYYPRDLLIGSDEGKAAVAA